MTELHKNSGAVTRGLRRTLRAGWGGKTHGVQGVYSAYKKDEGMPVRGQYKQAYVPGAVRRGIALAKGQAALSRKTVDEIVKRAPSMSDKELGRWVRVLRQEMKSRKLSLKGQYKQAAASWKGLMALAKKRGVPKEEIAHRARVAIKTYGEGSRSAVITPRTGSKQKVVSLSRKNPAKSYFAKWVREWYPKAIS